MSCWVCSREFTATVARGLRVVFKDDKWGINVGSFSDCMEDHIFGKDFFNEEKIYHRLRALNLLAYKGRYGEEETREELREEETNDVFPCDKIAPERDFEGRPSGERYLSLLKMLSCLRYQCAEDPAIDTEDYKSLDSIITQMQGRVVNDMKAYVEAGWGDVPEIFTKTA